MALITMEDVERERNEKTKEMIAAALVDFVDFLPDIEKKKELLSEFALTHGLDIENVRYKKWSDNGETRTGNEERKD